MQISNHQSAYAAQRARQQQPAFQAVTIKNLPKIKEELGEGFAAALEEKAAKKIREFSGKTDVVISYDSAESAKENKGFVGQWLKIEATSDKNNQHLILFKDTAENKKSDCLEYPTTFVGNCVDGINGIISAAKQLVTRTTNS